MTVAAAAGTALSFLVVVERNALPTYAEELARSRRYRPLGRTDSVAAALDTARSRHPDVVILDVAGLERLQQVPTAVAGMAGSHVVVVSGLPADVALLTTMAAGAKAFLLKPVDPDLLERTLSSVVAGHTVVDPRCTGWLVELALRGYGARFAGGLSLRQSQVLALVRGGLNNRQIGEVLGVSVHTVKTHLRQAMHRLGVHDRWAATRLVDPTADEETSRP